MNKIKVNLQYKSHLSNDWQTLGSYFVNAETEQCCDMSDVAEKVRLFTEADKKIGLVRVVEDEPRVLFQRPTAMGKKKSDDCHTYS